MAFTLDKRSLNLALIVLLFAPTSCLILASICSGVISGTISVVEASTNPPSFSVKASFISVFVIDPLAFISPTCSTASLISCKLPVTFNSAGSIPSNLFVTKFLEGMLPAELKVTGNLQEISDAVEQVGDMKAKGSITKTEIKEALTEKLGGLVEA